MLAQHGPWGGRGSEALLRRRPLEEDDNAPIPLELLAVPDGQMVAAAGALFF